MWCLDLVAPTQAAETSHGDTQSATGVHVARVNTSDSFDAVSADGIHNFLSLVKGAAASTQARQQKKRRADSARRMIFNLYVVLFLRRILSLHRNHIQRSSDIAVSVSLSQTAGSYPIVVLRGDIGTCAD